MEQQYASRVLISQTGWNRRLRVSAGLDKTSDYAAYSAAPLLIFRGFPRDGFPFKFLFILGMPLQNPHL